MNKKGSYGSLSSIGQASTALDELNVLPEDNIRKQKLASQNKRISQVSPKGIAGLSVLVQRKAYSATLNTKN